MARPIASLTHTRRGFSLTEILVALAISLAFLTSVAGAYIQISRAADATEARIQAHTRARNAIDQISREISPLRTDPLLGADQFFLLTSNELAFGDRIDNDGDGATDEEIVNGFDDDGDWGPGSDRHAVVDGEAERPEYQNLPDLGDANVDEDVRFGRDELSFRLPADVLAGLGPRIVTYRIDAFDTYNDVLVREEVEFPGTPAEQTTIEPVIFDVVGFDVLAWNPNDDVVSPATPPAPYWQSAWDAAALQFPAQRPLGAPFGVPPFEFPAALLIRVTVNAEGIPLAENPDWPLGNEPLKTVALESVVAIEEVIKDVRYQLYVRS